jgi:short subunit dehydrogenase-like uncharacterized protein
MSEIWVLGATGRCGRAIAGLLAGQELVLVGRDPVRLGEVAAATGGRAVRGSSPEGIAEALRTAAPAVVVNTVGPFTGTPLIEGAGHYVDLANELSAITGVLARHDEAVAAGRTLVTGAGFGVLATESAALRLCEGRPAPARLRVDAIPAITNAPGRVGEALAGTVIDAFVAGGRRYRDGRLVRARLGSDFARFALPDGGTAETGALPTGELVAAFRASGAGEVVAASGEAPAGRLVRALLPAAAALLSIPAVGRFAKRRLATVAVPQREAPRAYSWARARGEWPDGTVREQWLRATEGMAFTAAVAAEVARRLARGEGKPGAYTPGALFGSSLAEAAGGFFVEELQNPRAAK